MTPVEVGQQWRDRDKRMGGRVVTVTKVDEEIGYVWYKQGTGGWTYRSMLARFVKKFRLVEGPV